MRHDENVEPMASFGSGQKRASMSGEFALKDSTNQLLAIVDVALNYSGDR